ncbi:hypothetical protein PMAYCL1PPCAC_31781, partial [Pristionchus mayeri]
GRVFRAVLELLLRREKDEAAAGITGRNRWTDACRRFQVVSAPFQSVVPTTYILIPLHESLRIVVQCQSR